MGLIKKTFMKNLLFVLLFLNSCTKSTAISPNPDLVGEWRYVGNFSHLADYKCLVCPTYDYENEKYQVNFKPDSSIEAKVNLLIIKGKYSIEKDKLTIQSFDRLNKPAETPKDGAFINDFLKADLFMTNQFNAQYTNLQINIGNENYLLFVRK
jgi:hypothetical protein